MKTHGISGNGGGGGRTASPAPSNSATTTPKGKTGGKARTPASKKRKLAASGEDIDGDIKHEIKKEPVKAEQKDQVKSETDTKVDDELSPQDNSSDGSYNMHPLSITPDMMMVAAATTTSSLTASPFLALISSHGHDHSHGHGHSHYSSGSGSYPDEDILIISEGPIALHGAHPPTPLPLIHQRLMCTLPENCYGSVDHFPGDIATTSSQTALRPFPASILLDGYEHGGHDHIKYEHEHGPIADYIPSQTTMSSNSEHIAGHWLHEKHASFS